MGYQPTLLPYEFHGEAYVVLIEFEPWSNFPAQLLGGACFPILRLLRGGNEAE
jgi:hypothetical protein